jgi:hypothetical protein
VQQQRIGVDIARRTEWAAETGERLQLVERVCAGGGRQPLGECVEAAVQFDRVEILEGPGERQGQLGVRGTAGRRVQGEGQRGEHQTRL